MIVAKEQYGETEIGLIGDEVKGLILSFKNMILYSYKLQEEHMDKSEVCGGFTT